jgi:hypothetical protein
LGTNYHCGVVIKEHFALKFKTTHFHALGWFAEGGAARGCRISNNVPSGALTIYWQASYLQTVCDCIRGQENRINAFFIAGQAEIYQLYPENDPCGGEPPCNSNYSAQCLLRGCEIRVNPGVDAPGYKHRMQKCTAVSVFIVPFVGGGCHCTCSSWTIVDKRICGP